MNTVTYGLSCAPFLATLRQLADDENARFPRGFAVLRHDCYVDIVTGAYTKDETIAKQRQSELRQLCMAGGFPLKKWAVNHPEIFVGIPANHCLADSRSWEHESSHNARLAMASGRQYIHLSIRSRTVEKFTKRKVLSKTTRLFDLLG